MKAVLKCVGLSCIIALCGLVNMGCPPATVGVPNLEGLSVAQATTALNDLGLVMGGQQTVFHPTIAVDLITESQPASGTQVEAGSTVNVRVSRGNVVYVDQVGGNSDDGLTWDTAFETIQEAIDLADSFGGGQVWVSTGTYDDVRDGTSTGAVVLGDDIELYGGFDASDKGTGDTFEGRDWNSNPTIISGINGRGINMNIMA